MEISNLPDKELKETVIRVLYKLERRIEEPRKNFNKELENIIKTIRSEDYHNLNKEYIRST